MQIKSLLKKIDLILDRLDLIIPPLLKDPDWNNIAFKWYSVGNKGFLEGVPNPYIFPIKKLVSLDYQVKALVQNTKQFLEGKPANNVLLTGARGTGKSSLIKSLLFEYQHMGLRLIEIYKDDLINLNYLLSILIDRNEKFIIFCDDLSFEEGEQTFKSLKTILDGGISIKAKNVLIYATSNRRHLIPEYLHENEINNEQIHPQEIVEEKISLSERFGLWLHFYPFSQDDYLKSVASWLEDYNIKINDVICKEALNWAQARGNRSGRVAWQFVCNWVGKNL